MIDLLPIVLRVHTQRTRSKPSNGQRPSSRSFAPRWGDLVLVLDTETSIDAAQALTFGSARLCRWKSDGSLECLREYLFHADDLKERDPDGFAILRNYAGQHRTENRLEFLSRRDFLDSVLWLAFKSNVVIAGFNLAFDLSRLSVDWTEGRGRFAKGFSLVLWDGVDKRTGKRRENRFRSRVRVKPLDSKRSLMDITKPGKDRIRAKLLDLKTLAFALTDKGYSLASACQAFATAHGKETVKSHGHIDPSYIDYNRRDVLATQELLERLRAEFDRHSIDLDPRNALSPASIAKAYLRAMRVIPPGKKFRDLPVEVTAAAMTAYYGGRAECRTRKAVRAVVYCDFLSMYPTVNTLLGLWPILTAETLRAEEATKEAQEFLDSVTLEQCFQPATWKNLNFIALVEPQDDILPVRAPYAEGSRVFNIGVNPLTYHHPIPFAGAALVAAKLLSGKAPRVTKAWRLIPCGRQKGLRPVKLRSEIAIDPVKDDFFRTVIERRKALSSMKGLSPEDRKRLDRFLKVLANSGSYGIYAQLDRIDLPGSEKEELSVYGLNGPFVASTNTVERPGEFYFPPLAALIASGARLMLALLERCVLDEKGSYALCDTDSMAIALPLRTVKEIVRRFEALNPYDRAIVPGSILKIEDENFDPA
jgi:DNA polymerase type B, organellar and viral